MEWKLGSVMLLMSCSLQQSLWGILASVPQTTADKCKQKISSEGAPTKRVQMIRRIPARCSGWDEAWSWLSSKDCRTKYVLDYVELPSDVQKIDPGNCEEEIAAPTGDGHFNLADEKYLAIAFGSATVALLILIVIIVISVCRRGGNRCTLCSSSRPAYTSANASETEELNARGQARNVYVEGEMKLAEPMYEEIHDRTTAKKKLEFKDEDMPPRYENAMKEAKNGKIKKNMESVENLPLNSRRPVTPSAPYEEELQHTSHKSVPNEYSVLSDRLVQKSDMDTVVKTSDATDVVDSQTSSPMNSNEANGPTGCQDMEDLTLPDSKDVILNVSSISGIPNFSNVPLDSDNNGMCASRDTKEPFEPEEIDEPNDVKELKEIIKSEEKLTDKEEIVTHSYENLNRNSPNEDDYESLTKSVESSDLY